MKERSMDDTMERNNERKMEESVDEGTRNNGNYYRVAALFVANDDQRILAHLFFN